MPLLYLWPVAFSSWVRTYFPFLTLCLPACFWGLLWAGPPRELCQNWYMQSVDIPVVEVKALLQSEFFLCSHMIHLSKSKFCEIFWNKASKYPGICHQTLRVYP